MSKLAIVTALYERYDLTRTFLEYYQGLQVPGVELGLFCAVTKTESRMHALVHEYPSWWQVYAPNLPLTTKFAGNMLLVRQWKPDAMLILCSDDFASPAFILDGMEKVQETGFAGTRGVHYLDLGTDSMIYQESIDNRPVGAGRFLSRPLLESLDWMPWNAENERLDASLLERVGDTRCAIIERGTLLDVKMTDSEGRETNQTPFGTVRSWPHLQVDAYKYMNTHFPQLVKTLLP